MSTAAKVGHNSPATSLTLTPGAHLGPYEILSPLGAGGMGEVYRARDPRLNRDVALKILPPAFATDPERLHRFEQEARAAAALNHPNILAVFDIGAHDGAPYIVSELLEGETLRERLAPAASRKGGEPLPVRKAIESAVQIARGLAAAHEKGIIHRDLKPDNIFVTTDGRVKILDFGLAKLTQSEAAFAGVSALPTTPPHTNPGVVLGTVGYMSPEQVRGLAADPRSDLFALGTILYEMLSGRRAFAGDTAMDSMTAILKEDPPDLPLGERRIPPALGRIVDRCLEKSPAARFQTATDLAFALDALSSASGATQAIAGAAVTRRDRLAWTLVTAFGVVAVAAVAWAAVTSVGRAPSDVRTLRFSIFPPEGWQLSLANRAGAPTPLVMSPDGRRLAFVVRRAGGADAIWVRALEALTAQPLAGTEGASSIFWSPDSRFLGFFVGNKLKTIDAAGGPTTTLCELPVAGAGGTWSRDGVILFSAGVAPLQKVSASGGVPAAATTLGKGESAHFRPWFLPDGRHFLYSSFSVGSQQPTLPIFVGSLDSTERVRLVESSSTNAVYTQGHLLFLRGTTLTAQPFDLRRQALAGDAFPVAEQVQLQGIQPPQGVFSVSDGGVLVYLTGGGMATGGQLTWVDRTGQPLGTVGDRMAYGDVALSPDEKRAVVSVGPPGDLWTLDLARGLPTRFTFSQQVNVFPVWSPDGRHIAFTSIVGQVRGIYQKASNGVGAEEPLLADSVTRLPSDWSPDGRFLLYSMAGDGGSGDVWVLPLVGDRKPLPLLATPFNETGAKFSPDGRWIAYASDESGRAEVYVAPFIVPTGVSGTAAASGTPSGKWQVSTRGGSRPTWRRDGKEIFYLEETSSRLIAVSVNGQGPAFDVGAAQPLFTLRWGGSAGIGLGPVGRSFFDVTRDGRRFLVNMQPIDAQAAGSPPPITLVLNWTASLKK